MSKNQTTFDLFIQESDINNGILQIQTRLKNKQITVLDAQKQFEELINSVEIRDHLKTKIVAEFDELNDQDFYKIDKHRALIVGNGDIQNILEIEDKHKLFGIDGGMIGRAVFHNPWAFDSNIVRNIEGQLFNHYSGKLITIKDRLSLLQNHLELWQQTWGEKKNYAVLKKYFKIYISSFEGAPELRQKLMNTNSPKEAEVVIEQYLTSLIH